MSNEFQKFLKKLYDELYKDGIIKKKASSSKEKVKIVKDYIDKLERVQRNARVKEHYIELLKRLYYKRYVIKEEDIPNEYFEHLSEMYLEEGYGRLCLDFPYTDEEIETRTFHVSQVIKEQQSSIDEWLNYLFSSDSDYIPMWAKVWAFQGMLDIGTLNKSLSGYNRRNKNTVGPFVGINSELLGKCVNYLKMYLKLEKEEYPSEEIRILASSTSFYQIYGKLLASIKKIELNGDDGIWVKYNHNSESDALKLYNDLQGYNTGWCTAATKEIAKNQICGGGNYIGGDFYVYFTKDKNNEYKIPRIAIRMNDYQIGEVRGIAKFQNIETEMDEILDIKLKEFSDGQQYMKRVSDMKRLTQIYKKYEIEDLSDDELRFLYEIDRRIEGLGYGQDPRIEIIQNARDIKKDLAKILECKEEQIAISPESIIGKDIVYYKGHLELNNLTSAKDLKLPKYIKGFLDLNGLISTEGLVLPEMIHGFLRMNALTNADGLKLPKMVGGVLDLQGLEIEDLLDVDLPEYVMFGIRLKSGGYTLENLKNIINAKRENRLINQRDFLELENNNTGLEDQSFSNQEGNFSRKGYINILMLIIPILTILVGIIVAYILCY